jgi:hypothetical protein
LTLLQIFWMHRYGEVGSSFEAVRDDISVKEAVMVSFLETAGSDTESEVAGSRGILERRCHGPHLENATLSLTN